MTIDWNAPLEAYHPDGRVVYGRITYINEEGQREFSKRLGGLLRLFYADGSAWSSSNQWRIRNRKPANAPSPELVAVARWVVENHNNSVSALAKRALAELEPVDPDLELAREVCAEEVGHFGVADEYRSGERDDDPRTQMALAAIKRVRAEKG